MVQRNDKGPRWIEGLARTENTSWRRIFIYASATNCVSPIKPQPRNNRPTPANYTPFLAIIFVLLTSVTLSCQSRIVRSAVPAFCALIQHSLDFVVDRTYSAFKMVTMILLTLFALCARLSLATPPACLLAAIRYVPFQKRAMTRS